MGRKKGWAQCVGCHQPPTQKRMGMQLCDACLVVHLQQQKVMHDERLNVPVDETAPILYRIQKTRTGRRFKKNFT